MNSGNLHQEIDKTTCIKTVDILNIDNRHQNRMSIQYVRVNII